uniref:Uncharacterized protein n=1 Tax=Panagrolaimus superbus TaxID=310955 RepID=A0A914Y5I0_9BILA
MPSTAGPSTMPKNACCIQVGPDGRIIDGTTLDATTSNSGDGPTTKQPKRSKSITAINSEEYCVRSDSMTRSTHNHSGHGFRTPQSLSGYKCKQTIDPRFWRYSREHSVTNTDAMFKRLEKIGEGSYATVLKGENRYVTKNILYFVS